MPLPKLKYSREQLEEIRGWVATNNWKLPKPPVAPSTQIRAEDLESTLLKGGPSAAAKERGRDERKPVDRRDERDHRPGAGGHDDWGPRGRNRNREAFEEGYDYELQMKAQNKSDLQDALKAEEVRVAQKKRRDEEERRQREEIEQEEKAIQQQEEQGKIYEAQQMFGVAGVDERDTVWGAPKAAKKHSRFAFQDVEDEEEKKRRDPRAPASTDFLDPFEGVKVSTAVHLPPQPVSAQGAVIAGAPPKPAPASTAAAASREPAAAKTPPTQPPSAQSTSGSGKTHGQDGARQRRDDKHQPPTSGNRQNPQGSSQTKGSHSHTNANPHGHGHGHGQSAAASAGQPAFVDPCIVSMSTDSAAKTRADTSSAPSTSAASKPAAAGKGEANTASVSALFAKLNIGGTSTATPSGGSSLHGAVDASQLESQLLAKQQPLQVQAVASGNQPSSQTTYPPRQPAAVAPQPVAPTSPPQKSAPPPPYQAQPQTTNPNTPPMMPMTVGGQQIHVAGHPGFLMMPQGYPLRPGQLYYPQQYFQMPPPPPQGSQGQGRSY